MAPYSDYRENRFSKPRKVWRNVFILYFVFVKKQRTIERKKKRSKISIGKLLCEQNLRADWRQIETVRAEIGPILHQRLRRSIIRYAFRAFSGFFFNDFCRKTQRTNAKSGRPKVADWKVAT